MLDPLLAIHMATMRDVPLAFKRYLFGQIDWNSRCLCLTGARGVGKTTLLSQYIKEKHNNPEKCLYISADHVDVAGRGLYRIAENYFTHGGEQLVIDEVHKYPSWQVEVKNIVDTFRSQKLIISGSSSLDLKRGKADLSRRFVYYDLKGLSFREYLQLAKGWKNLSRSLDDILQHHVALAAELSSRGALLGHFSKYLSHGYYPFVMEGEAVYLQKVLNVIEKVFYEDVAIVGNLKQQSIPILKRLLWMMATSVPFTVNMDRLSRELGTAKEYIYHYLDYLEDAGLINTVRTTGAGFRLARKPSKVFLENTNLLAAVGGSLNTASEIGTQRETFFVNQLRQGHKVCLAEAGDFVVDEGLHFEVGGRGKDFRQMKGVDKAFVAADGIEIGAGGKIPLYLFGFLY